MYGSKSEHWLVCVANKTPGDIASEDSRGDDFEDDNSWKFGVTGDLDLDIVDEHSEFDSVARLMVC